MDETALKYYSVIPVKYNLFGSLKNRETVLFKEGKSTIVLRPLRIYNVQSFDWHMERVDFKNNDFKMYNSVFHIDWDKLGLPPGNLNDSTAWKKFRESFSEKWEQSNIGYDFIIDLDGGVDTYGPEDAFKSTREWACKIHEWMTKQGVPHLVNMSGRGFHVRVPNEYLADWASTYKSAAGIASRIGKACSIPTVKGYGLDISIYDRRRIIKTLYSVSNGRVVLPVTSGDQLASWELKDYAVDEVMRKINLRDHYKRAVFCNESKVELTKYA